MFKKATGLFAVALVCMLPVAANAQLASYSQDFEGLVQSDTAALENDGWLVFGNVFGPSGSPYLYGYGPFVAPNNPDAAAFSLVAAGQGGAAQGAQQLVIISDYNNGDHASGNVIEANVFQEFVVGAGDVGTTWVFQFDGKRGDLAGSMSALAFIKTLNPAAGFALTNFLIQDMTAAPTTWQTYQLSLFIDAGLVGQLLQIGFLTAGTNYDPSGVYYDNINFAVDGVVPNTPNSVGSLKGQFNN
jgi:hypothetical protein